MDSPCEKSACRAPQACELAELRPLIQHLESGEAVGEILRFPRGTVTPDGRLDLCKQDIGPRNIEWIASAMKGNPVVRSLLLGADFIGDAGTVHVAGLLKSSPVLENLFLECNRISSEGLQTLCDAAKGHPRLRGLWLKRNRVGSEGADHIARLVSGSPNLRTLDLADTQLGSRGLATVVRTLVEKNRSLERLYVCANGLVEKDAETLGELVGSPCPIQELYLSVNRMGDAGCRILANACSRSLHLRVLGLSSTGVSEEGAVGLSAVLCAGYKLLTLELGQSANLKHHAAWPNRVGDEGAVRLAQALRPNVYLERLFLGGNRIGVLGGMAFLEALTTNRSLCHVELGRHVPREVKRRISELIARNRKEHQPRGMPHDIAQVQSVYRTRLPRRQQRRSTLPHSQATPDSSPEDSWGRKEPEGVSPEAIPEEDLKTCVQVLRKLRQTPSEFFAGRHRELRAAANQVVAAIVDESRRRKRSRPQRRKRKKVPPKQPSTPTALESSEAVTEGRHSRVENSADTRAKGSSKWGASLRCYICKSLFSKEHHRYRLLCPRCAEFNLKKRTLSADCSGQVALLTGGRIKIGHHVALKLLDAGCTVYVTTRFPCEAAERFCAHESYPKWRDRLHIIGIDLRDLPAVKRLGSRFTQEVNHLDILINNAAMTIHRPPGYYAALVQKERQIPAGLRALIHPWTEPYRAQLLHHEMKRSTAQGEPESDAAKSVVMAGFTLVPEPDSARDTEWFPQGGQDADGLQLDLRSQNSWSAQLEDVPLGELLEVHLVSSFAPFVLVKGLLPLLRRSPAQYRHIVNVSAMEGSFSRSQKTERHPHTNMAKAGLNMLTRTIAGPLGMERILVNSVDTGWITDERPYPQQVKQSERFVPPLDKIDGAARVCDPIFRTARGEFVGFGQFFKDYRPVGW